MISVVAIGLFGAVFSAPANADSHLTDSDQAIKNAIEKANEQCATDIKTNYSSLFWPGANLPLIPDTCTTATGTSGTATEEVTNAPLRLEYIPNVIARLYGFLASLSIYLFGVMMAFWGTQWAVGGLQYSSSDDMFNIKKNIRNAALAMLITLIISFLIVEVLNAIGIDTDQLDCQLGNDINNTSLDCGPNIAPPIIPG